MLEDVSAPVALVLMVGLPGAGKTCLALRLTEMLVELGHAACVVSLDDFVSVGDQIDAGGGLKLSRQALRRGVEAYLSSSHSSVPNPLASETELCRFSRDVERKLHRELGCVSNTELRFVFIDDNNYYRSMRYEYYQTARNFGCGYFQIFVECDIEEAVRRDASRPSDVRVGRGLIENMSIKLEPPAEAEVWEARSSVRLKSTMTDSLHDVVAQVLERTRLRVPPVELRDEAQREQDRRVCSTNQIHVLDRFMRKFVGDVLRKDQKLRADFVSLSTPRNLAWCKREILADARGGGLPVGFVRILDSFCAHQSDRTDDGDVEFYLVDLFTEKLNVFLASSGVQ